MNENVCPGCHEYDVDLDIHGSVQLRRIVAKLKAAIRDQRLSQDEEHSRRDMFSQPSLVDLDLSETLPDVIEYYIKCTQCERVFLGHQNS